MGILDSILGKGGEKTPMKAGESKISNPFFVSLNLSPIRLAARKKEVAVLKVTVKNNSDEPQLFSVDFSLPKNAQLGFDQMALQKTADKKGGEIKRGESKEVTIEVWSNNQTKEGTYEITLTVYSHHLGYEKVMGYVKKTTTLRVI